MNNYCWSSSFRPAIGLLILVLLAATGCSRFAPAPPANDALKITTLGNVDVQIDGTRLFQTIDGFGTNINGASWNNGRLAPALDLLSKTMGGTIFRVILETADWEATNDNADPQTFNWDDYRPIYESPKFQSLWNIIRYLEQDHKNVVMLNVMGWIPDWMGGKVINETAEDEWVEMIASAVYYGRNVEHLDIRLLSPANEIDIGYPEGPLVGPEQYARLLNKLILRLQALGLSDIRIVAPDIARVSNIPSYAEAMVADKTIMEHVDHFAFHSYGGDSGDADKVAKESGYAGRNFWMTEFSQWCQRCDTGGQVSDQWAFAAGTADYLLQHLEQGAAAGLIYDGFDSLYQHHRSVGYWGLLAYDEQSRAYTPRKRFYANAQIFKFVRPGMRRIGTTTSTDLVKVLAFVDPATKALTIVGRNPTGSAITLNGSLNNLGAVGPLALIQTTQTANLVRGDNVRIAGTTFSATIAPDSIFTLTTIQS